VKVALATKSQAAELNTCIAGRQIQNPDASG
jgi:hypothetical protein